MRDDVAKVLKMFQIPTFGNKKNIENAEKLLHTDEQVLYISPTNCIIFSQNTRKNERLPGIAILTTKRFIFNYKIMLNTATDMVTLDEIRSVSYNGNGMTGGHLEIHTITKTYDILVSYRQDMMQYLQELFMWAKNNAAENNNVSFNKTNTNQNPDIISQIERLAELRDKGIITDDEFQNKKQELLLKL